MIFAPRAGAGPLVRSAFSAIATGVLLVVLVMPAAADEGGGLNRPAVSPAGGTTATTFELSVVYRHRGDDRPDYVGAVIGGRLYRMTARGQNWRKGVTFSVRTTLPVGRHKVVFVVADRGGVRDHTRGPSISVKRSAPVAPQAKPKPAPDRVPARATPRPAATPRAIPRPATTATPNPKPPAEGAPDRTAEQPEPTTPATPATAVAGPGPTPDPPASRPAAPAGPAEPAGDRTPPVVAAPGKAEPGRMTARVPAGWGDLTNHLEALGLDPTTSPLLRLMPVMVGTTGGVALSMAFGLFAKRRRDGEPPEPDEVLAAKAARGAGAAATAALVPAAGPLSALDAEAAMPRWRRPSLLQARKEDPLRSATMPRSMTFDQASAAAPLDGYERRLIRYLVVGLLDRPDEFRATAIGTLGQGDEVQLIEQSGTYWRVLCPDGRQGWIHRMTLGDLVGEPASPSAKETWASTAGDVEEIDEDVLTAFMTARGRA